MSRYDVIVVGSGPGGSVTARECARAGLRVLVLEEGPWVEQGETPAYSWLQMQRQYRNRGLTAALGRPAVAYTEAACVGGGSEVNSGLYHRPSARLLADWSRSYQIERLSLADLKPHLEAVEARLQVRTGAPIPASALLARGAARLGWSGIDVPRWVHGSATSPDQNLERQSMTQTYLTDATGLGVEVRAGARVQRLDVADDRVTGVVVENGSRTETIWGDHVFVCAGAVQSPALLQRSGIKVRGRGFSVHPTVKAVAKFEDPLNVPTDLASYQINEFAPEITIGGSASRESLIALALSESAEPFAAAAGDFRRQQIYYAAIRSRGTGRVRALPGFRDPLVTYRLHRSDMDLLRSALARLLHVLMASGATRVVPCYAGAQAVEAPEAIAAVAEMMTRARSSVMTVHLAGTLPLGDRPDGEVDSYGRVRSVANVTVNDASLLPTAPGINPQGTVMAIAHRNAAHFLGDES